MKLLTEELRERLLKNGCDQQTVKGTSDERDFWPVVKLFYPAGPQTWLLISLDPEDEDIAWALSDLGTGVQEFGTVRLSELEAFKGFGGLGIERDLFFEAKGPISAYIAAAAKAGYITEEITPGESKSGDAPSSA